MIRATIVKEVVEVNYIPEPTGWADYTAAQRKQYVLEQMDEGNIDFSEVIETRSVYNETLRLE